MSIYALTSLLLITSLTWAQAPAPPAPPPPPPDPAIVKLVSQLELERYKATIKGLTQFGDRRQGTDRNRAAVDWIEARLKSYGCTNVERLEYIYDPPPAPPQASRAAPPNRVIASGEIRSSAGGWPQRGT